MTAVQVIREIESLPPQERQAVIEFVSRMTALPAPRPPETRTVDEGAFEAVSDRLFDQHPELFRKLAL